MWLGKVCQDNGVFVCLSGAPGLVDRVFAVHAGSRGFDSHWRHVRNDFSDPVNQDIHTQSALSWKIVVSEWRSLIAVSLNIGGGLRLIKLAKLYMCRQTHYRHNEDGSSAQDMRGHGFVPLSHSGNVFTRIGLHTVCLSKLSAFMHNVA